MDTLDRSLIATLAYYGSLGRPLTVMELMRRMIPLGVGRDASCVVQPMDVIRRCELLALRGIIQSSEGHHVLTEDAYLLRNRSAREQQGMLKWRRMRRYAWWLQVVPFTRALFASGSLALGTADPSSDWDMFVVARQGRLYTARLALLGSAWLMGRLRTKHTRDVTDRFCFNHYIATNGLSIRHRSIFTAHSIASMVPVIDRGQYLGRLWQANRWIRDFCTEVQGAAYVRRTITPSRILTGVQWLLELPLQSFLGDAIEWAVRRWQQYRIRRNPATNASGGRIVADAFELEFHPHSFEAIALARYNEKLRRQGLGTYIAYDSGLKR